jgi:hypothetical protein
MMEALTMPHEPSAAQSIYPNLKSSTPDVVQRTQPVSIAAAMYPSLVPKPPAPAPSRYRGGASLVQRVDMDPTFERMLAAGGIRRIRNRERGR